MSAAYAAFANEGYYIQPIVLLNNISWKWWSIWI
jgi:membrane carboxypeptidase/penicillin-binding protein